MSRFSKADAKFYQLIWLQASSKQTRSLFLNLLSQLVILELDLTFIYLFILDKNLIFTFKNAIIKHPTDANISTSMVHGNRIKSH